MQPLQSRLHNGRPLNNSRNRRAIIHGPAVTSDAGSPTYRELDDVLRLMAIAGQPLIDGSNSSGPTNARSRAYALNGRTIVWRHNLLPLGISANRARMLFPLLTADSGWTRRANNRSKSLVFQGIIDNHP
jgi:hypothetical protein